MVSEEEKRWIVVGIIMYKVAAPVLRDFVKQGMDTHYTNLDAYCNGLTTPGTLKTLTYHQVNTDPILRHLKFQNVNNNFLLHGRSKQRYNHNINTPVDLAKLYLPDYLAEFSAFDESLDMTAILHLLGSIKPAAIFHSPNPFISIQFLADDVRENVRNQWGHFDITKWSDAFFTDCVQKLQALVKSLGLTADAEKKTLDELDDWYRKGTPSYDKFICSIGSFTIEAFLSNVNQHWLMHRRPKLKIKENVRNCLTAHLKVLHGYSKILIVNNLPIIVLLFACM